MRCSPVKNGWHLLHTSMCTWGLLARVCQLLPQAQVKTASTYSGCILAFMSLFAQLQDANLLLAALAVGLELHPPERLGEDRKVATHAHVHARVNAGAPLPYDDGAGEHQLTVVAFDAQPLGLAVAAVLGAAAAFLVCHRYSVSVFFRVRFGFSVPAGVSGSAFRARVRRAGFASTTSTAGASAVASGAGAALGARVRRAGLASSASTAAASAAASGAAAAFAARARRAGFGAAFEGARRFGLASASIGPPALRNRRAPRGGVARRGGAL